jgi:hypothetical protein
VERREDDERDDEERDDEDREPSDEKMYTSAPLTDEHGNSYVIQQQNVGRGQERGGGEWPDPHRPPEPPAPGAE